MLIGPTSPQIVPGTPYWTYTALLLRYYRETAVVISHHSQPHQHHNDIAHSPKPANPASPYTGICHDPSLRGGIFILPICIIHIVVVPREPFTKGFMRLYFIIYIVIRALSFCLFLAFVA